MNQRDKLSPKYLQARSPLHYGEVKLPHLPPVEAGVLVLTAALSGWTSHAPSRNKGLLDRWDCSAPLCFWEEHMELNQEEVWQEYVLQLQSFTLLIWKTKARLEQLFVPLSEELRAGTLWAGKTILLPLPPCPQGTQVSFVQSTTFINYASLD